MTAANENEKSHKARLDSIARRPKEFDDRVMAYWPGLKKAAAGFYPKDREKAVDLVTETIAYSLANWEGYRPDGGFWLWLFWNMRGQFSNQKKRSYFRQSIHDQAQPINGDGGASDSDTVDRIHGGVAPSQESQVELSQVLEFLAKNPAGEELLRHATGETFEEISINAISNETGGKGRIGVSKQAVQYRVSALQKRLVEEMR